MRRPDDPRLDETRGEGFTQGSFLQAWFEGARPPRGATRHPQTRTALPAPSSRPPGPPGDPLPRPAGDDAVVLYGWHPVCEALANEKRGLRRLLASENAILRLQETFGEALRIAPELVRPAEIGRLLGADAVHQGLYLEADPLPAPALDAMPEDALLLALDQITDPHNVGAIVRTAAAFGVTAS